MFHPATSPSFARRLLVFCAATFFVLASQSALAQRVALVIGNSAYRNEAPLRNAVNDAKLLAQTLRDAPLKFDQVIEAQNLTRAELLQALARFRQLAQKSQVAFVYFSGHGMINSRRQNHLLPVEMPRLAADASLDADTALKTYGISEDEVIEAMEGAKVQVVVLDACRDNGFDHARKSTAKGLARRSDTVRNRLLAYATEEGHTAEDGKGNNSTYAQSLARNLRRTDWPLLRVFDEVASDVEATTKGAQSPTRSGNLRTDVYLLASVVPEPVRPAPAPVPVAPAAPAPAPVVQRQPYEPEMVRLPAGSFLMGSPSSEPSRYEDEGPQRRVSINAFELGKTEVTQGQWRAVMGSNPSRFSLCGDNCPVDSVSWHDVQEYIRKLNQMTGKYFRLPSEAEWEYSARAGCDVAFNVGGHCSRRIESNAANFNANVSYNGSSIGVFREKTTAAGSFNANSWGLSDMHGNVWEWVQDCYEENYSKGQTNDGKAHKENADVWCSRVLRGGSWDSNPQGLRSAIRSSHFGNVRNRYAGFRLARSIP